VRLIHACDHRVPQLRPRFVLVAVRQPWSSRFRRPEPLLACPPILGEALADLMGSQGWPGAPDWVRRAGVRWPQDS
jgi:DNA (cytosine-5)-methyltransferase 1